MNEVAFNIIKNTAVTDVGFTADSSSGAALKKKKSKAVKEESLLEKLAIFLDPSKEKKGVGAGFREGTGITKLRTIMSEKLSGILKGFKGKTIDL